MRAKEFFQQVERAEAGLRILRTRLQHYEDIGLAMPSGGSATGGHPTGSSRVEASAIGMADTLERIQEKLKEYGTLIEKAERVIDKIPQEKYQDLLKYRYLAGITNLAEIGEKLGYKDPNSIYRAHGWALAEADKILKEEPEDAES